MVIRQKSQNLEVEARVQRNSQLQSNLGCQSHRHAEQAHGLMVSKTGNYFPIHKSTPEMTQKLLWKPGTVTHTYNPKTWKDKPGGSLVLGLPGLQSKN